jgi:hypothetical protein
MYDQIDIPEFGVGNTKYTGRTKSSKYGNHLSKSGTLSSKSGSKTSKPGNHTSALVCSDSKSGAHDSFTTTHSSEFLTKEHFDKTPEVEHLEKKSDTKLRCQSSVENTERSGKREVNGQNIDVHPNKEIPVVQGNLIDSLQNVNGILNPVVDQRFSDRRPVGTDNAVSVGETLSRYFTNLASEQIRTQEKKQYHTFAEAKADFLQFDSNDLKSNEAVGDSSVKMKPEQECDAVDVNVTLRETSCLLQQFHEEQKAILSGVRNEDSHSVENRAKMTEDSDSAPASECSLQVQSHFTSNNSVQICTMVESCKPEESLAKSTVDGYSVLEKQTPVGSTRQASGEATESMEENNLDKPTRDTCTDSAQDEKPKSRPPRPVKRSLPGVRKNRGLAQTLAIVQGKVQLDIEDEMKNSQSEVDSKTLNSSSVVVCGEKADFESEKKNSKVLDLKSGVPVSVSKTCNVASRENDVDTVNETTDVAKVGEEEMFVIVGGVALSVKRSLVSSSPNVDDAEEYNDADDIYRFGSDDTDSDTSSDFTSDTDESWSDSEKSDSGSSDTESADFIEGDGGLCYRRGYSKIEEQHTKLSMQGVNTNVSDAEADFDLDEYSVHSGEHLATGDVCVEPVDLSVHPASTACAGGTTSPQSASGSTYEKKAYFHEHETGYQDNFEGYSASAYPSYHGNEYSQEYDNVTQGYDEEERYFPNQAADYYGYQNDQYFQPFYSASYPEYQAGSYGNQYGQGHDGGSQYHFSGDQYGYYGNHQNHCGYSRYKDSPHYREYVYHLHEAQRLEQRMQDEHFNKKMELYMHKAYVIQNMCLDEMKEYLRSNKDSG